MFFEIFNIKFLYELGFKLFVNIVIFFFLYGIVNGFIFVKILNIVFFCLICDVGVGLFVVLCGKKGIIVFVNDLNFDLYESLVLNVSKNKVN